MMGKISVLITYLMRYPFRTFCMFIVLILGALSEFVSLSLFVPILDFIQQGSDIQPTNKLVAIIIAIFNLVGLKPSLFNLLIFAVMASSFQFFMVFCKGIIIALLFFPVRKDIRNSCFSNLMNSSISYFDNKKSGDITNIMIEQINQVGYAIDMFVRIIADILLLLVYLAFIFMVSWKISLAIFILGLAKYLLTLGFVRRSRRFGEEWLEMGNLQVQRILESVQGIHLIKSLSRENYEMSRFADVTVKFAKNQVASLFNTNLMKLIDNMITPLAFAMIIFVGVNMLHLSGSYILIFIFALMRMIPKVTQINENRNGISVNMAGTEAILDLLDTENKPMVKSGNTKLQNFQKVIMFENVDFRYQKGRDILKNISFSIEKGKSVAFVGASGSGKTTIINLLLHLYDVNTGTVTIDGVDICNIDLACWHRLLGVVSQDTFIFNDNVYNNIFYGDLESTKEDVILAAKKAHIHDVIVDLEDGYDTLLGERGVRLSGGQRQRVGIARAIIGRPQLLIFDEATSSLDSVSEELIKQSIDEISRETTTVIVAHRLSTVRDADKIIVLDKGKIVETGTHSELLSSEGMYSMYYRAQINDLYQSDRKKTGSLKR